MEARSGSSGGAAAASPEGPPADAPSAPQSPTHAEQVLPAKQRWRLVLARDAEAPRVGGRELTDAWDAALEASGLPFHRPAGRTRARIAFAAPLPLGIGAEHELAELFLAERVPLWQVRNALEARLPAGWRLVDLFDVWVGGPPLAGRVIGAQYRVGLGLADAPSVQEACRGLMGAASLPRTRQKGDALVPYDLRPLLWSVRVTDAGPPVVLRIRTRIHPELGSGRPEEVIAALGERIGRAFDSVSIVRERMMLAGEDRADEEFDG